MSNFELIEFQFSPDDFNLSLEDEFLLTKLTKEIETTTNPDALKEGCLKLLHLAVHRQAMIRNLIKRLADLEFNTTSKVYKD